MRDKYFGKIEKEIENLKDYIELRTEEFEELEKEIKEAKKELNELEEKKLAIEGKGRWTVHDQTTGEIYHKTGTKEEYEEQKKEIEKDDWDIYRGFDISEFTPAKDKENTTLNKEQENKIERKDTDEYDYDY